MPIPIIADIPWVSRARGGRMRVLRRNIHLWINQSLPRRRRLPPIIRRKACPRKARARRLRKHGQERLEKAAVTVRLRNGLAEAVVLLRTRRHVPKLDQVLWSDTEIIAPP